jgi:hypothetical protein
MPGNLPLVSLVQLIALAQQSAYVQFGPGIF